MPIIPEGQVLSNGNTSSNGHVTVPYTYPLDDVHRHTLHVESGISAEVIVARGYRSLTAKEAAETLKILGFSPAQCQLGSGLLFPITLLNDPAPIYQFRPDVPRLNGKDKPCKYEYPAGKGMRLIFHPSAMHALSHEMGLVVITEGAKKVDALISQGIAAMGVVGVDCFAVKRTDEEKTQHAPKRLLPDWQKIRRTERPFLIAFDSDAADKPAIQRAEQELAALLMAEGADVSIARLQPDAHGKKQGVDDFFARGHTLAELRALAEDARFYIHDATMRLAALADIADAETRHAKLRAALPLLVDCDATVWMERKHAIKALCPDLSLHDLSAARTELRKEQRIQVQKAAFASLPNWRQQMLCDSKSGVAKQTFGNLVLAIEHLEPWVSRGCWYDVVRERHMLGHKPLEDADVTEAASLIERALQIPITNLKLLGSALDHVCRHKPRDLLLEWVETLRNVPQAGTLLTTWLEQYCTFPTPLNTEMRAYVADLSRILPVSIIARILKPGCQQRLAVIFEGDENLGKSKLAKQLAGEDPYGQSWHVALSSGMEGKEAHMMLQGALVCELEEMSAYTKTDENRVKALVRAQTDSFVPKFSNKRVDHPRRTIFIGTVNPEGDGTYLKGQTGNTRWLPISTVFTN